MNYPQRVLNWISGLIFPVRCIECGRFSSKNNGYICKKCIRSVPLNKKFECIGCRRSSSLGLTCLTCRRTNHLDQLLVVSDYENSSVIKIIKTFKYRFIKEMAIPISWLLKKYVFWLSAARKFNLLTESPIIIPVPLHYRRLNWRGFNQAELIAQSLSEILNCNFDASLIKRTKIIKPQAEIEEREQRINNVRDIFQIIDRDKVKNKTVLLIDDVCTTGATLNEGARILKESGAAKIIGLVFARG